MTLPKGKYYIGDLSYILDFENFSEVLNAKFNEISTLKNGKNFIKFEILIGDYKDNKNFTFCIDSEIFGIIDAEILNGGILAEKILTCKNDTIFNKTTNYPLSKIVTFSENFEISKSENELKFGNLIINL